MADALYALEKLGTGLSILESHPGRILERLQDAYVSQMVRTPSEGSGISEDLGRSIEELHHRLTSREPEGDEGSIAATFAMMTEDEAVDVVTEIQRIYHELRWRHEDERGR